MSTLKEKLLVPSRRPDLVRDCSRLIDEEVDRKSGLSAIALKAAFKTVKAVKPGFVESVIELLLDSWVDKLEGHYVRYQEQGAAGTFGAFVSRDSSNVAEKLLEVTDARAKRVEHRTVASLYEKLRPGAKDHVIAAVPGLGRVVDKYLV